MNFRKYLTPILHILAWAVVYFLPDLLFEAPTGPVFLVKRNLHFALILFFFYLNYFVLVPRLLLHKKQLLFSAAVLLALVFSYYTNDFVMQNVRKEYAKETIENHKPTGQNASKYLEKRRERHRHAENAGTVVVVLMGFFISTIARETREWYVQEKERKEMEKQKLISELSFLKSQVNPHFLFNSLNGIYALAIKKSDKTPDAVLQLSELMRHMLYESEKEEVTLEKEVAYLQNYIQLQRLRMPSEAQINFDVEGDIGERMIAPMLFIPFVENGFKHGAGEGARIQIKLIVKDSVLTFDMINSISDATSKDASSGIGLANVRKRLQLLYGSNHYLDYKESNGNFVVHLQINLRA